MATVTLPAALDSQISGSPYLFDPYTVSGASDYGEAVRTSGDSKYITRTETNPGSNTPGEYGVFFADEGDLPGDAVISQVKLLYRHRSTGAVDILIGRVKFYDTSGSSSNLYFDGKVGDEAAPASYTTWELTLTTNPITSSTWTRAELFEATTNPNFATFSIFTSADIGTGDATHEIDYIALEVTYTGTVVGDPVEGWYRSDVPGISSGVDATQLYGASARPKQPRGIVTTTPWSDSKPMYGYPGHAVAFNNRMIYAGGDYTVATDLPPIRVWNGTSDYQLCTIPKDGSGNIPNAISTIINGDGSIYLGTWDTGTTSSNVAGRVLKLDPNSGQLTNVGNVNSLTGYIPWALHFHNGELWAGMHRSDTSAGRIYRIKPNEQTTWTQDRDLSTDSVGPCTVITAYQGKMYFGSAAASGTFAKFGSRDTSGTYSLLYTGTGGTAQDYNGFYAACVFNDALYFSYWNPDTTEVSLIKKYDGSSVTTAKTVTDVADVPIIAMFVDSGVLYALGSTKSSSTYVSLVLSTTDGATWTDRTADLPLGSLSSRGVTNAFAVISY